MSSLGQNEQDYYQQCVALSRKGDIASLKQLMSMYLVAGDNQKKKDARKALKKAYDRQSVLTVIRSALDSVSSSDQKLDILWLAISIDRSKFLFEYLSAYCLVKGKIKRSALEDISLQSLTNLFQRNTVAQAFEAIKRKSYLIAAPNNFIIGLKAVKYAGYTFEIPALIKDEPVIHGKYKRVGPKIGRNDPCPCGSGKKYKKCCGR